jgi:carbon storage regulator CsrA
MLMLMRNAGEHIVINDEIRPIVAIRGDSVRLGIAAPGDTRLESFFAQNTFAGRRT